MVCVWIPTRSQRLSLICLQGLKEAEQVVKGPPPPPPRQLSHARLCQSNTHSYMEMTGKIDFLNSFKYYVYCVYMVQLAHI